MMKLERVQKLLSNYGFCSRRYAEDLIKEGLVKVNGKTISIGDQATEKDKITVDNQDVTKPRKIYLMFNKPHKCVTALTDQRYPTVMNYIKIKERVFPVGRLDYDTTGLLLMTNDGDFANKVMHPRNKVKKTYLVKIARKLRDDEIKKLEKGIWLSDGKTAPAKVKGPKAGKYEITIHEGRNRIIKRMFKELGFKVLSLKRIKIGQLKIDKISSGKYRFLRENDLKKVFFD